MILSEQEGQEEVIGGFRETKRGIDAYAQTFRYDPGRSQKDFATIEDAMDFVESFRQWELDGVQDVQLSVRLSRWGSPPCWTRLVRGSPYPSAQGDKAPRGRGLTPLVDGM